MGSDYLWWKNGIIYQIYPRSFSDSNGDGIGDLNGITARLDYLADLGIDAIWLSPINTSPDKDFGYDISNYEDIDPKYGTLADFDRMVAEAHKRGIRVVMDGVFNHTSDQHPWFVESRKSKDNPYRNWYLWRPGRNGGKPNNWQSIFGGDGWQFDQATGEYYFHMFVKEQPDLNWRNPAVPRAILEAVRFWLDRGVDGFRLDVFNAYFKHPDLPDNPPKLGLRGFDRQHHIYDTSQPEMMPFLADLRALLDLYPERYAVGETFLASPEQTAAYMGDRALHAAFNFDFLQRPFSAAGFARAIQSWSEALGPLRWPNNVLNNHDNPRTTTRYHFDAADRRSRLAALMLLTLRGTPFLYYGEEIGMRDISVSRAEILDPVGKKFWPFHKGRDGCRSPMQWNASPYAGFSTAKPWLKVHPEYPTRNVEAQQAAGDSLLHFYRQVIHLRKESPALHSGEQALIDALPEKILGYQRSFADNKYVILLNFGASPCACPLPAGSWKVLLSTHNRSVHEAQDTVELQAYEGVIFSNQS